MSDDIKEMEAKIKEIKATIKEAQTTKNAALGEGILKAVKEGFLSWDDLKPALQKVVKKKKDRKLLKLGELPPPLPTQNQNNHSST